ncbi:MAG: type II secretion system protein [Verrucomicrobia bacterium]|nr:type II secretion system protein [Verrucomicrobiota bacterium]
MSSVFPQRQRGFTLLELVVVIALIMLLLALAVPAVDGIFASGKLQKTLDTFDEFVTGVREQAVSEQRTLIIVWKKKEMVVLPDGLVNDPDAEPLKTFTPGDAQTYNFFPKASLEKNPAAEWTFWANGTCEPAEVSYAGDSGTWTVSYSALAGRRRILSFLAK